MDLFSSKIGLQAMYRYKLMERFFLLPIIFAEEIIIARFNPDGTPDISFGTDGVLTYLLGGVNDVSGELFVQPDGKILFNGVSNNSGVVTFHIVRLLENGLVDEDFGSLGELQLDNGGAIGLREDGKILLARRDGSTTVFVNQYNSDGTPDFDFGINGEAVADVGGNTIIISLVSTIAFQSDGKFLLFGSAELNGNNDDDDFMVLRFTSEGELDTTFDSDGVVFTDLDERSNSSASGVIQDDGKILVAGASGFGIGSSVFSMIRYNPDGSLDPTFDEDGKVLSFVQFPISEIALQEDQKIVAVGQLCTFEDICIESDLAIGRLSEDGMDDESFGTDGKVFTNLGGSDHKYNGLALQEDGNIVAVGQMNDGTGVFTTILARYLASEVNVSSLSLQVSPESDVVLQEGESQEYILTVNDENDSPVLDAMIQVTDGITGELTDIGLTDVNGQIAYTVIVQASTLPGDYSFSFLASKEGFLQSESVTRIVTVEAEGSPILVLEVSPSLPQEINLGESITYTLNVTDATGIPVEGAVVVGNDEVALLSFETDPTDVSGETTYTSTSILEGDFVIDFTAVKDGFDDSETTTISVTVEVPEEPSLTIEVNPSSDQIVNPGESADYTIIVSDLAGDPVSGAIIAVEDEIMGTSSSTGQTDSNGQVGYTTTVAADLALGDYSISFTAQKENFIDSETVTVQVSVIDNSAGFLVFPLDLNCQNQLTGALEPCTAFSSAVTAILDHSSASDPNGYYCTNKGGCECLLFDGTTKGPCFDREGTRQGYRIIEAFNGEIASEEFGNDCNDKLPGFVNEELTRFFAN